MRLVELDRKDWIPQTYMEFDPTTHEFLGYSTGMTITRREPENLYDVMLLASEKGILFNNIKVWDKDTELIACRETKTGIEGYYNPNTKEFKSAQEIFESFDKDAEFSIK